MPLSKKFQAKGMLTPVQWNTGKAPTKKQVRYQLNWSINTRLNSVCTTASLDSRGNCCVLPILHIQLNIITAENKLPQANAELWADAEADRKGMRPVGGNGNVQYFRKSIFQNGKTLKNDLKQTDHCKRKCCT